MIEIYNYLCKDCNKVTKHIISKLTITRGARLKCVICGRESGYKNFKYIELLREKEISLDNWALEGKENEKNM